MKNRKWSESFCDRAMAWRSAVGVLAMAAAVIIACGDVDNGGDDDDGESASGVYEGDSGLVIDAVLDPDPPLAGEVDMEMELTVDGQLLEGADVDVEPWMPSHDHGSNTDAEVHEHDPGHYVVDDLTFSMSGVWELRVDVAWNGEQSEVVWDFEVQE